MAQHNLWMERFGHILIQFPFRKKRNNGNELKQKQTLQHFCGIRLSAQLESFVVRRANFSPCCPAVPMVLLLSLHIRRNEKKGRE